MQLKDILKGSLKVGGLALLLSLNSCSSKKSVIENYLNAVIKEDADEVRSYCSERWVNRINWNFTVKLLKNHYKEYVGIHDYIPEEGDDNPEVYWIEYRDGDYERVSLIKEEGSWKIEDIGGHVRRR